MSDSDCVKNTRCIDGRKGPKYSGQDTANNIIQNMKLKQYGIIQHFFETCKFISNNKTKSLPQLKILFSAKFSK